MLEEVSNQLTAEALAERMEQEEEEVVARKLDIVQEEDEEQEEEEENEEEAEDADEEEDTNEEEEEEIQQLLAPSSRAERTPEWVGLEVSRELQAQSGGKKQITFSEHKYIYHYPKEEAFEEEEEEEEEEEWMEKKKEGVHDDDDEEFEEEEEDDEDDPVMEAERLKFNAAICFNPEAEAEDECVFPSPPAEGALHSDISKQVEVSGLRMRNRRET